MTSRWSRGGGGGGNLFPGSKFSALFPFKGAGNSINVVRRIKMIELIYENFETLGHDVLR
jgi:hypothetical protein